MPKPPLMTWAEIEAAYRDEWVLLADVEYEEPEELFEVRRARVVAHDRDHDRVFYGPAWEGPGHYAISFAGERIPFPEGLGVLL